MTAILLGPKVPLVISRCFKEAAINQMSCVERTSTHSSYGSFAVRFLGENIVSRIRKVSFAVIVVKQGVRVPILLLT